MRHKRAGYKLKRDVAARRSLLRNLVTSVIIEERVSTTVTKAKAAKPLVDKMISLAKRDLREYKTELERKAAALHARRQAGAFLSAPAAVKKLFDQLGSRFSQRKGGYTRIVRLGPRPGDGAEVALLELVGSELVKRAADRAKRREERLKAMREGREGEEPEQKSE
jgi:large subunit ribosomal protein L17